MNERVLYFVEGDCEKKLIDELKKEKLLPSGKSTVFNVLTRRISFSRLMEIGTGSIVIFVFDTDGEKDISILKENLNLLRTQLFDVSIVKLIQVKNLEDELVRSTDIKQIIELTNSKSIADFKVAFLRTKSCLSILKRHSFDINRMWCTKPTGAFCEFSQDFDKIKKKKRNYC